METKITHNPHGPDYIESPEDGSLYAVASGEMIQVPMRRDGSADWESSCSVDWAYGVEEKDFARLSMIKAALGAEH
jgi:hypothetical protein